ncbi:hypothetical protein TRIP_B350424 [uncultured Desulfatiglans sp.]|uniref:Uncharacterized protein n=1 Tax=Uncultured Desulfatiglans sp. TaxID=1748965 RepID=A0A653ACV1_UNCDX|nr:hypothetical protein TRIP_B350424 [uncultured Desulfatiglans sp.]
MPGKGRAVPKRKGPSREIKSPNLAGQPEERGWSR